MCLAALTSSLWVAQGRGWTSSWRARFGRSVPPAGTTTDAQFPELPRHIVVGEEVSSLRFVVASVMALKACWPPNVGRRAHSNTEMVCSLNWLVPLRIYLKNTAYIHNGTNMWNGLISVNRIRGPHLYTSASSVTTSLYCELQKHTLLMALTRSPLPRSTSSPHSHAKTCTAPTCAAAPPSPSDAPPAARPTPRDQETATPPSAPPLPSTH